MDRLLFGDFERVNREKREVEGYFFVNEACGDGWTIKRQAIADAIDQYMQRGNLREMHTSSAVGKVKEIKWHGNKAYLKAKIVDDQAWEKIKEGVYTGFSVGIKRTKAIGSVVLGCRMVEISVVDIPADNDANIEVFRSISNENKSVLFEEENMDNIERASLAEYIEACADSVLTDKILEWFKYSILDAEYTENVEENISKSINELKDFIVNLKVNKKVEIPNEVAEENSDKMPEEVERSEDSEVDEVPDIIREEVPDPAPKEEDVVEPKEPESNEFARVISELENKFEARTAELEEKLARSEARVAELEKASTPTNNNDDPVLYTSLEDTKPEVKVTAASTREERIRAAIEINKNKQR